MMFRYLLVFGVISWWGTGVHAAALSPELRAQLKQLRGSDEISVVAWFKAKTEPQVDGRKSRREQRKKWIQRLKQTAAADQRSALARIQPSKNRDLWMVNARALRLTVKDLRRLAKQSRVKLIELDRVVRLQNLPAACGFSPAGWNTANTNISSLWNNGQTGQGVVVATLDSGVDSNHSDLSGNYRGGTNSWFDPHGEHATPHDANGHGTSVMGVLAGGSSSGVAIGMAPDAQWIAAKIFNDAGDASLSDIHASLQWALDPDGNPNTDDAPDVVNASWVLTGAGIGTCNTEFQDDISALKQASIAVVFAAGNTGPLERTSMSPANYTESYAVGSIGEAFGTLFVAGHSARGPSACDNTIFPTVVAPGANIVSADLTAGGVFPDTYACSSGTSLAAPHVAGAMAVLKGALISNNQDVSAAELEEAITNGAIDLGAGGPDNEWGHGLLDVASSYQYLLTATAPPTGELQFNGFFFAADEAAGVVELTLLRSKGSAGDIEVELVATGGAATSGTDYTGLPQVVSFGDGQQSAQASFLLLDDSDVEGDENIVLSLANPTGGAGLGDLSQTQLLIVDNDVVGGEGDSDVDGDGFSTPADCDDTDAGAFPGAAEIKHDGIDQSCNGFDLTLEVTKVRYVARKDYAAIWATSALGADADLNVEILLADNSSMTAAMIWNETRSRWQYVARRFTANSGSTPMSLLITGAEGTVIASF